MSVVEMLHYHMVYFGELNAARQMSANQFSQLLLVRPARDTRGGGLT